MKDLLPFVVLVVSVGAPVILVLWARERLPWVRARQWLVASLLVLSCVTHYATGWVALHYESTLAMLVTGALMLMLVALGSTAVPLGLFWLRQRWLSRRQPTASAETTIAPAEAAPVTRRAALETCCGLGVLAASSSALGWGMLRGRIDYELTEIGVPIAGLPRVLDGYSIVQLSDIHAGLYVGEAEFGHALELVKRARPDLLVVTGDLVDNQPAAAGLVARRLSTVTARDGVVAVLGNHDYYSGAAEVARAFRAGGHELLVNRTRLVRPDDAGGFALVGLDDLSSLNYAGRGPDLAHALRGVPEDRPKVVLSHQPSTVDRWAGQVQLQLSGHTHGGQFNPAGAMKPLFRYLAGAYDVSGTTLYVNRGFGTSGPPVRLGSPPEVTRIVLIAA